MGVEGLCERLAALEVRSVISAVGHRYIVCVLLREVMVLALPQGKHCISQQQIAKETTQWGLLPHKRTHNGHALCFLRARGLTNWQMDS